MNTPSSVGAAFDARTGALKWVYNPKSYEAGTTTMSLRWNQRGEVQIRASRRLAGAAAVGAIVGVAVLILGRDLGNESAIGLYSDTPHYLLNGAFLVDFLRDLPLDAPFTYAQQYYARYPGLTLGHHPLLSPVVEIPFFWLLGVSVYSGRLSVLATLVVMLLLWHRVIDRHYGLAAALFSTLLLASATGVVATSQQVESEPLALCSVVAALYFLQRFGDRERQRDGLAFVGAVVVGLYAKQLTVMVFPVYVLLFTSTFGVRALLSRRVLLAAGVICLCAAPMVALTLKFSQYNVQLVTGVIPARNPPSQLMRLARAATTEQAALPVIALAAIGAAVGLFRRDRFAVLLCVWLASVVVGLVGIGIFFGRYAIYGAPAICGLAASVLAMGRSSRQRLALGAMFAAVVGHQAFVGAQIRLNGGGGYEEAARFVTEHRLGDSVLYLASQDNGFFVFFVRKHDPSQQQVILRADKVLSTSRMRAPEFERLISRRDEIEPILKRFGVGFVVVENVPRRDGPLEWLRQAVQGDRFSLRRRIPIETTAKRLQGVTLDIYEYKDRTAADADALLSIDIPVMGDRISLTFGDLMSREHRR